MNTDIPVDLDKAREEILRYFDGGQETYAQMFLESMIEELRILRQRSVAPILDAPAVDSQWLVNRCENLFGKDYDSESQNTALKLILSQAKASISEWEKMPKRKSRISPDLAIDVCKRLDEFQRNYDANTHQRNMMPGNDFYWPTLLRIVEDGRKAMYHAELESLPSSQTLSEATGQLQSAIDRAFLGAPTKPPQD